MSKRTERVKVPPAPRPLRLNGDEASSLENYLFSMAHMMTAGNLTDAARLLGRAQELVVTARARKGA